MKTKNYSIMWVISVMFLIFGLSGCGSYKQYAETKREFSRTESVRMQSQGDVILKAFAMLVESMNGKSEGEAYLVNQVYYDEQGRKHELKVKDGAKSSNIVMMSMQVMPVLEKIYQQQQLQMDAPPTPEGVAMEFVRQLPALGAIWGFVETNKNAGSTTTTASGAGSNTGTGSGTNQPVTTTTTTADSYNVPVAE